MSRDYTTTRPFIIYGVYDGPVLVYVGSSEKVLHVVEYNHRNYRDVFPHDPYASDFRVALERFGRDWDFRILQSHHCSRATIEKYETLQIMMSVPIYNYDMNPYATSVSRGRIVEDVDEYFYPVVKYVTQLS